MTVIQKRFHLNGHTLGFHPQTQKLEPPYVQHNKQYHRKVLLSSAHLNGHAHYRFSPTDSKVRTTLYSIVNSTKIEMLSSLPWMKSSRKAVEKKLQLLTNKF